MTAEAIDSSIAMFIAASHGPVSTKRHDIIIHSLFIPNSPRAEKRQLPSLVAKK
jgi:hypothetical protein